MAQDSIAYGESLLADVRERNDKAEKRAKKDARRGEWKGLAAKIGMSVANDVFAQRQENFLNNEQLMSQKLSMQKVDNASSHSVCRAGYLCASQCSVACCRPCKQGA